MNALLAAVMGAGLQHAEVHLYVAFLASAADGDGAEPKAAAAVAMDGE